MTKEKAIKVPSRDEMLSILKEAFGDIETAAEKLRVTTNAIYIWHIVPPKRAIQIEEVTKGRVNRSQLRPDWFPRAA